MAKLPKGKRKKVSPVDEAELLFSCARRCCVCYGLNNDFDTKKGQVAHLNKNRADNRLSNLVWLCMDHHNEYDSSTSQSKGYRVLELKKYRSRLESTVRIWRYSNLPLESGRPSKVSLAERLQQQFSVSHALADDSARAHAKFLELEISTVTSEGQLVKLLRKQDESRILILEFLWGLRASGYSAKPFQKSP